jgi:hypothetical protein
MHVLIWHSAYLYVGHTTRDFFYIFRHAGINSILDEPLHGNLMYQLSYSVQSTFFCGIYLGLESVMERLVGQMVG